MSTSTEDIIRRYATVAGTPNAKFLYNRNLNVYVGSLFGGPSPDDTTIYSYGSHFPMATLMPGKDGNPRGWWLLNGDRYSPSTTRHQSVLRNALKATDLPMLIIPFSALNPSGIVQASIEPVEILPDRYTWEPATRAEAPSDYDLNHSSWTRNWQQLTSPEEGWAYEHQQHHLGESVFKADFRYTERPPAYTNLTTMARVHPDYINHSGSAYFLSAFDTNEGGQGLYFLAQLPEGAQPQTVAGAFEALKPAEVTAAELLKDAVLRQGDVFAVNSYLSTRDLPGPSKRSEYVLDVNHQVTEVRIDGMGNTYGRGWIRHRPQESWRRPEHRSVKLGDGKTWYQLVKNTVPAGRSWSVRGEVD